MSVHDKSWKRSLLRVALSSTLVIAVACSDDDDNGNPPDWSTTDSAVTTLPDTGVGANPDAATGGDASVPAPDGSVIPNMDSSVTPGADTGVSTPDASGNGDGDGGMDSAVEADGAVGDGGLDDGAGDAGLDGAVDGAVGDAGDGAVVDAGDGAAVDGGLADAESDAGTREDLGKGNGSDVVLIGDSWMDNDWLVQGKGDTGDGISRALQTVSRQPYRNYAKQGTRMLGPGLFLVDPPIPSQWDQAVRANRNIKTVVMTGGGNDIILDRAMIDSCKQGGPDCARTLTQVRESVQQLWNKMAAGGVRDIVHIVYAKVAGEGVKDIDASNADLQRRCDAVPAPTRCRLFYTDSFIPTKAGLISDGIHPTAAVNTRIAEAIFDLMVKEGIRR